MTVQEAPRIAKMGRREGRLTGPSDGLQAPHDDADGRRGHTGRLGGAGKVGRTWPMRPDMAEGRWATQGARFGCLLPAPSSRPFFLRRDRRRLPVFRGALYRDPPGGWRFRSTVAGGSWTAKPRRKILAGGSWPKDLGRRVLGEGSWPGTKSRSPTAVRQGGRIIPSPWPKQSAGRPAPGGIVPSAGGTKRLLRRSRSAEPPLATAPVANVPLPAATWRPFPAEKRRRPCRRRLPAAPSKPSSPNRPRQAVAGDWPSGPRQDRPSTRGGPRRAVPATGHSRPVRTSSPSRPQLTANVVPARTDRQRQAVLVKAVPSDWPRLLRQDRRSPTGCPRRYGPSRLATSSTPGQAVTYRLSPPRRPRPTGHVFSARTGGPREAVLAKASPATGHARSARTGRPRQSVPGRPEPGRENLALGLQTMAAGAWSGPYFPP